MKATLLFAIVVGTIACGVTSVIVPSVILAQEPEIIATSVNENLEDNQIHVSTLDLTDDVDLDKSLTRTNLALGTIGTSRLLYSVRVYRYAVPNAYQTEDVVYRGNSTTRIRAIRATEIGFTQYARPYLLNGGLNYSYATVRLQSAVSYGYDYVVDFWG